MSKVFIPLVRYSRRKGIKVTYKTLRMAELCFDFYSSTGKDVSLNIKDRTLTIW